MVYLSNKAEAQEGIRYLKTVLAACLMILLGISPAHSYVLKGPHILELMVGKLAGAKSLRVDQRVTIEDSALSAQPMEVQETLRYLFPARFRSDMNYQQTHRIYVQSHGQNLTVIDGVVAAQNEGRYDRYKDLILNNTRYSLHKMLTTYGVDVGITSLGRMDDRIVYVIGAKYPDESASQLWVDKNRFVPLRWINVLPPSNPQAPADRVEFVYRNWQKLDEVWYPMQIVTLYNGRPVRTIQVAKVQADVAIDGEGLNIAHLMTLYRKDEKVLPESQPPADEVDEVKRTIEDFKKKFEP